MADDQSKKPAAADRKQEDESFRKLCSHYSRACSLVSPCCGKVYPCRLCHNEIESHEVDRFAVKEIVCRKCDSRQVVAEACVNCSVKFARHYCSVCHLYDDAEKGQFHCAKCGICRVGGRDNFFHCDTCGLCLPITKKDLHKCVQQVSHSNCPVCMEDIHTSRDPAHVPKCGHLIHMNCFSQMLENGLYQCPQCQTSLVDMSSHWRSLDAERQQWVLPVQLRDFQVKVQCRDCQKESETDFHFVGLKCPQCGSYNTVRCGSESFPLDDASPIELHRSTFPLNDLNLAQGSSSSNDNEDEPRIVVGGIPLSLDFNVHHSSQSDSDSYESLQSPYLDDESEEECELYHPHFSGLHPLPIDPLPLLNGLTSEIGNIVEDLPIQLHMEDNSEGDSDLDHWPDNDFGLPPIQPFSNHHQLVPTHMHPSTLSGEWETGENDADEKGVHSDGWETASEEVTVGGNAEDLGKEECHLSEDAEQNVLGDMAPAH